MWRQVRPVHRRRSMLTGEGDMRLRQKGSSSGGGNSDPTRIFKKKGGSSLFRLVPVLASLCVFLQGCDYGRMKEQESVRTYESKFPEMPSGSVPVQGGLETLRVQDLKELKNPLDKDARWVDRGKEAYGLYCGMCHGPRADGHGTVGQSFHPLPSDLRSREVQELSDGEIFGVITFGSRRSPPLGYTVSEEDRWAIIRFLRSLRSVGN